MNNNILAIAVCLALTSCGSAGKPAPHAFGGVEVVALKNEQKKVVDAGVRKMVAKITPDGGESAKLASLKAFLLKPGGAVQVCGEVSYSAEPGNAVSTSPYYVELEQLDGQPFARRGQVGSDKLKKSKVDFLCRHLQV